MIHNFGPGTQRVHNSERCGPCCVHPDRHFVEPIAEKMPVLVQGHRSAGVPEHLLHDLDVGTRGDRQGSRGVPEFMRVQPLDTNDSRGLVEAGPPEDGRAQRTTATHADEDQIVRSLALHVLGEFGDQERRDGNLARLVALRRAPHLPQPLHNGHRLGDQRSAPQEVDASDSQRSQFAEPDSGVAEEKDHQPVGMVLTFVQAPVFRRLGGIGARVGELLELRVGQVPVFGLHHPRQVHPDRDVADQPAVLDR